MAYSVAFKCTYNNGGEGEFVGFSDTCSTINIERNVTNARVWCSDEDCPCRQFYDKGMKGAKPVNPCHESRLFREWRFGAGSHHLGEKRGTPIHMRDGKVKAGEFAILTTRFPNKPNESQRRIIGVFQIGEVIDEPDSETMLIASPKGRVRLRMAEAKELYFWEYYRIASKQPDWRTGLFRYLNDTQAHRILADMATIIQDNDTKAIVNDLIAQAFGKNPAPPALGYSVRRSKRQA